MAELEQKWQSEVDEAQQGKLENNAPFFHDYHFFEVHNLLFSAQHVLQLLLWGRGGGGLLCASVTHCVYFNHQNKMKELELLCSLKEVPLDFSDLENVVLALR